jgi:hypothetical protein
LHQQEPKFRVILENKVNSLIGLPSVVRRHIFEFFSFCSVVGNEFTARETHFSEAKHGNCEIFGKKITRFSADGHDHFTSWQVADGDPRYQISQEKKNYTEIHHA